MLEKINYHKRQNTLLCWSVNACLISTVFLWFIGFGLFSNIIDSYSIMNIEAKKFEVCLILIIFNFNWLLT